MFRQRLHPLTASGALSAAILIAYLVIELGNPTITPVAKLFAILIVLSTISVMLVFVGVIRQSVKAGVRREAHRDMVKAKQLKAHVDECTERGVKALKEALPQLVAEAVAKALARPGEWRDNLVREVAAATAQRATAIVHQREGGELAARVAVLERDHDSTRRNPAGDMHVGQAADDTSFPADGLLDAELRGYLQRRRDEGEPEAL